MRWVQLTLKDDRKIVINLKGVSDLVSNKDGGTTISWPVGGDGYFIVVKESIMQIIPKEDLSGSF